jgi:alkanesulfonate monooxygenase SsuD/methylene tetrahydromethanopterin reductase-like flavin-dependent oxidoreductase (luciferase family)
VYDHFHTVPLPTQEATHEAWTLMAAFAAATSRVKLGQMCTCMAYRNPAYLAKVAATVDAISGGRAQMGIGAGWYEHEWRAYGYGFPGAGEKKTLKIAAKYARYTRLAWIRAHLEKYVPADVADSQVRNLAEGPLVGTPERIAERLSEFSQLGMSYAIINLPEVAYDRSGLTLFTEKVAPALAAA